MRALAIALLCGFGITWAKVDLQIPDAGSLGYRRIARLVIAPSDLARLSIEDRQDWAVRAQETVEAVARSEGYLDAMCPIELGDSDSAKNKIKVKVDFQQGKLYRVSSIEFQMSGDGSTPTPDPADLPLREGSPLQENLLAELQQKLTTWYSERGWLDASATYSLEKNTGSSSVAVHVDLRPGLPARFDRLDLAFEGRHATREWLLQQLWGPESGDTLRASDLNKYQRKLLRTRLFSTLRLERRPTDEDSTATTVRLTLKERVPGSVQGLLSWEPVFGTALEGSIRHRNVLGRFHELSLTGRMAERIQSLRAGYATPLFFGSALSLDYGLTLSQQTAGWGPKKVGIEREFGITNEGTFSYPVTDAASVSLTLNTQRLDRITTDGRDPVLYQYSTILGGGLDYRNQPYDPTDGWWLRGQVGRGGRFFSDSSYIWIQGLYRVYQPLISSLGAAWALDGGEFLNPTTEDGARIFWQGGRGSVRSWPYRSIALDPDPVYGLQPRYVRSSGELRLDLPFSLQAASYLDWVRLWNRGDTPAWDRISRARIGYGSGVRWKWGFLMLRLDWSFGRGPQRLEWDLGQAI